MQSKQKFPRVLMINSQSLYKENATGITLRSLWAEWDSDCCLELYIEELQSRVEDGIKFTSERLPISLVGKMANSRMAKKVNRSIKVSQESRSNHNKRNSLMPMVRQWIVCAIDSRRIKLSDELLNEIDNYRPQVIYTLGASVSVLHLVRNLSIKYQIPIIIHFMDNWAEHIQWENNPLLSRYHKRLNRALDACMPYTKYLITISPSMAEAYSQKFKKQCYVLMNAVKSFEFNNPDNKEKKSSMHFVYAGGLHLDRWKALKEIATVLQKENSSFYLDIYTSGTNRNMYEEHFSGLQVRFHDPVPHDRIAEIYKKADVLVHTEQESELLKGFFKYSISTKIPEYLSTGKIILFYGPRDMKLFDYLSDNKVALTASNPIELSKCISQIAMGDSFNDLRKNAEILAAKNHSSSKNRLVLLQLMEKATCCTD